MQEFVYLNHVCVPKNQIVFSYKNNSDPPQNKTTAKSTLTSHAYYCFTVINTIKQC